MSAFTLPRFTPQMPCSILFPVQFKVEVRCHPVIARCMAQPPPSYTVQSRAMKPLPRAALPIESTEIDRSVALLSPPFWHMPRRGSPFTHAIRRLTKLIGGLYGLDKGRGSCGEVIAPGEHESEAGWVAVARDWD
jgi:hypothetical protein